MFVPSFQGQFCVSSFLRSPFAPPLLVSRMHSSLCVCEDLSGSLSLAVCTVGGIPLPEIVKMGLISQKEVDDIVQRTRDGGGEIVS